MSARDNQVKLDLGNMVTELRTANDAMRAELERHRALVADLLTRSKPYEVALWVRDLLTEHGFGDGA